MVFTANRVPVSVIFSSSLSGELSRANCQIVNLDRGAHERSAVYTHTRSEYIILPSVAKNRIGARVPWERTAAAAVGV